jgi:putative transposase
MMKLTLQIQLLPNNEQAALMRATIERFNEAADWLAGEAFARQCANKFNLQKLYYSELRQRFRLSAQMAVRCVAQVCEAYSRDKSIRPHFRPFAAMPFDQRIMKFKGNDHVSLRILDNRILVPMVMGEHQRQRFSAAKGQCDLVLRRDGKWFLHVTVKLPDSPPAPPVEYLGVDMGTVHLAADSDGQIFDGADVEATRMHYQSKRRQLQRKASNQQKQGKRPKNVRRKLRALSRRESRYKTNTNHVISKRLVEKAKGTGRGIAIEDLTGIRERTQFRKHQRDAMGKWAFAQLQGFIEYKGKLNGVEVKAVDPAYTSQMCHECRHVERGNRRSRGIFWCKSCGNFDHADINAAKNIAKKASVNTPDVAETQMAVAV